MKRLHKNFIIVLSITIFSKIASFISELIIAYLLGTSIKSDIYSMINGIHQVVYPMLSIGIWSVFLPMYKKIEDKAQKQDFFNKTITFFSIVSFITMIIVMIFSNYIICIVANGFSDEMKLECSNLLRLYSPYFLFVIISSIYAAVLQSEEKFFASQIREIFTYLPTIILGPLLYKYLDVGGLILALLLGGILRLLILLPFAKNKFHIDFNFKENKIIILIRKLPSVLLTSGIEQVNILIDKIMASHMFVGSVASLNYGGKLVNVFNGLFSMAISTAIYPTIIKLVSEKKKKELSILIEKIITYISMIIIPLSFLLILLSDEIVTLAFKRGAFNEESVKITSMVFSGYLFGMFYMGIKSILNNIFYSINDTISVTKISLVSMIINVILNFLFVQMFGLYGLSFATSISCLIYCLICFLKLNKLKFVQFKIIFKRLLNVYIMSLISFIICVLLKNNLNLNFIIYMFFITMIFGIIYFAELIVFNKEEVKFIYNSFKEKIGGKHGN